MLKTKYGKESEIVNAYISGIMSLPTIHGTNPNKILEFYEKLCSNVQSLETMGKLGEVNGYVRMTLNKLEGIRGDLVGTDDDWQEWKFPQLLKALRKWTVRNPPTLEEGVDQEKLPPFKPAFKPPIRPPFKPPFKPLMSRSFQANQQEPKRRPCVYCKSPSHQSTNYNKVTMVPEGRKQLILKQLCFNCTGANHRAEECRCVLKCMFCQRRYHSSICENTSGSQQPEHMLVATGRSSVT